MSSKVDVIIISNTVNSNLYDITQNYAINSCVSSDDVIEVAVIETNRHQPPFDNCRTYCPFSDIPFSYSRYANFAISVTKNPFICIAHNDCHFHPGWASRQIKYLEDNPHVMSTSAYCMYNHRHIKQNSGNYIGHEWHTPWCFFHRREIYDIIGPWDEQFVHKLAFEDMRIRLRQTTHAFITGSTVNHIRDMKINVPLHEDKGLFVNKWGSS